MSENKNTEAVVASVQSGDRIIINKGRKDKVLPGFVYQIYSIGDEIIDPITKTSLGKVEIIKGEFTVFHIQENMTTLEKRSQSSLSSMIGSGQSIFLENQTKTYVKIGDFARVLYSSTNDFLSSRA